jgi:hypothetical protein
LEFDAPTTERQVGGTALVAALGATCRGPAVWSNCQRNSGPHDQTDPIVADIEMIDDEDGRYAARRSEAGAHPAAPSWISAISTPLASARVSQSQSSTPIWSGPLGVDGLGEAD